MSSRDEKVVTFAGRARNNVFKIVHVKRSSVWAIGFPINDLQLAPEHHLPVCLCNMMMGSMLPNGFEELDVNQKRNFEYFEALKKAGKNVRLMANKGVGHAFQVLDRTSHRTPALIKHMAKFINQPWHSSIIDRNYHVGQA
eukprot:Gb_25996 [translate_table: standard]